MDHRLLVYKIDNPVQSSLLSSLVLTLIQDSSSWLTLKSWVCNTISHLVTILKENTEIRELDFLVNKNQ